MQNGLYLGQFDENMTFHDLEEVEFHFTPYQYSAMQSWQKKIIINNPKIPTK